MRSRWPVLLVVFLGLWSGAEHARSQTTVSDLYASGVKARLQQRFDNAVELLTQALTLKPDNADALVQLGFSELGLGDLSAARNAFSKALALAPNYADAKFGLAQVEFRSANLDAAASLIEPLVHEQPANGEFSSLLANITKARQATLASQAKTAGENARTQANRRIVRPDPVSVLIKRGRDQRLAGKLAEAEQTYREALRLAPRNSDILVALGLVAGSQQKFDEAGRFFGSALAIQPNNIDARLGQIRLAVWQGNVSRARHLVDNVLASRPNNAEARLLNARVSLLEGEYGRAEQTFAKIAAQYPKSTEALLGLGDARRASGDDSGARIAYHAALAIEPESQDIQKRLAVPPPRNWRLDIGSEVSSLSAGRGRWTDSSVGLSYRVSPDTALSVRTRVATRYGKRDVQIENRIDHAFSQTFSAYGLVAITPKADFLAKYSLGAGASWQALPKKGTIGPTLLNVDIRDDRFANSNILIVSPWIQGHLLDGRLGLSARWVHAQDDQSTRADGYVLRADTSVTPRMNVFIGYSDSPEISDGTLDATKTVFGGASFDLSDSVTLRGNIAHERRSSFVRDTFGLGITVRF